MAKQLDPRIGEVLKKYNFGPESAWDCHGTWVVYHRVLEQIAVKAKIVFSQPFVASADPDNVAICVTGTMGEQMEWSIGEAAPKNNKNAYPWAMAEKRAKDRVILKLIGLHGFAYSEDEADDFKDAKPQGNWHGPLNITALKAQMRKLAGDLDACTDHSTLDGVEAGYKAVLEQCERDLPDWYYGADGHKGASDRIADLRVKLEGAM